jgi:hypothetical protein
MRFRVSWHRGAELGADYDSQLVRGGLLVRAEAPALAQFSAIDLELVAPDEATLTLKSEVVQSFPGVGVAVTFAATPALELFASAARSVRGEDRETEHVFLSGAEVEPERATTRQPPTSSRVSTALRGGREERMAIMRENVPALHGHVLKNPNLQLDEVVAIAKSRSVSPQILQQIADKREWAQRPEIAIALVRNPKTPVGAAVKLLDHVTSAELRQLAKDANTRAPIQRAARRKLIG